MGSLVRIGRFSVFQFLLFISKRYAAYIPYQYSGTDDADNTERIGAGITVGYLQVIEILELVGDGTEGFVGGTKTGGVGDGTIQSTGQHGEIEVRVVKEKIIASEHHGDVEQYHAHGHQVEGNAASHKTLEESRSYLQANAEHEEDESEVL